MNLVVRSVLIISFWTWVIFFVLGWWSDHYDCGYMSPFYWRVYFLSAGINLGFNVRDLMGRFNSYSKTKSRSKLEV